MKLKKSMIIGISAILTFAAIGISSAAWFQISNSQTVSTTGSTAATYFAGGNGTEEDPYIITRPVHMYNLAWLQYNGEFNNNKAPYHFRIGGDGTDYPVITELDMSGYILPPIGTVSQPFIGVFDGNDATITNLQVSNVYGTEEGNIIKKPTKIATSGTLSGVNIVGLFGVVGDYAGAASSYDTSATSIFDLKIKDAEIRSQLTSTLIGVAAGYVNGNVLSNVGIINSKINLPDNSTAYSTMTTNVSDYAVIGYQKADEGKSTLTTSRDTVSIPATDYTDTTAAATGQVAAWGASIDMKSIYGRCLQKFNEADAATDFIAGVATGTASQTVIVDNTVTPPEITEEDPVYTNVTQYYTGSYRKNYNESTDAKKLEGQYFYKVRSGGSNRFMLLSGNSPKYDDDVSTLNITTKTIKNYENYRGSSVSPAETYYQIYSTLSATDFYTISATYNGRTYYMTDAGSQSGATTDESAAAHFHFTNPGGSGYIYIDSSNYINHGTNSTTLYIDSDQSAYTTNTTNGRISGTYNRRTGYFAFNGTKFYIETNTNNIRYATFEHHSLAAGTYYLASNGSELFSTTDSTDASTYWTFSNYGGNSTTIKAAGSDYYLHAEGITAFNISSVNLSLSTTSSSFTKRNSRWAFNYSNSYYYLSFSDTGTIIAVTSPSSYPSYREESKPARTVYLAMSNGNLVAADDVASATNWHFSNETRTNGTTTSIFSGDEGKTAYLVPSTTTLAISTSVPANKWTYYNGRYCYVSGGNRYYLTYNSGWTVSNSTSSVELAFTDLGTKSDGVADTETSTKTNQNLKNVNNGYYETYLPLSVQGETTVTDTGTTVSNWEQKTATTTNFAPTDTNTGYLVSGGSYGVSRTGGSYDNDDGDIRVSWFYMSDMDQAIYNATSYTEDNSSRLEVITRTQGTGDWVRISDDYNENNTTTNPNNADNCNRGIRNITTKTSYSDLGLKKYKSSRNQLHTTFLEAPRYIYGMHFMDAAISMNNIAVAEKAHVDEHDYDNYELPRDSVNFKLRETGYINFFAGTYYNNSSSDQNNSFFSLHKIERNATGQKITAMHQISKIYGKDGDEENGYWYLYDDNSDGTIDGYCGPNGESTAPTAGWAQIFDCAWIMQRSDLVMDALYYFEIPVFAGEYALGSVPSSNSSNTAKGAYLMYLDIGASAARVNRTIVLQTITKNTDVYIYPRGIAIIANAAEDVIDYISAAYALSAGYEGSFGMSKTGNVITSDADTGQTYSATFQGEGISLEDADTGNAVTPTPESSETFTIHRTTMIDYNRSAKEYSMTVIDDYMDAEGNLDHREVRVRSTTTVGNEHVWGNWTVLDNLGDWATDKYTMTYIETPEMGYAYSYYAADGVELKIEWGLDYEQLDGDERHDYQQITGLTLTINGETTVVDPNDIVVTMVDGQTTYTITVNGTTITVTIDGDNKTFTPATITITPTVVPPNNP